MHKERVKTVGDALAYITDCNLATVQDMAPKKSRPKNEYSRQKKICQIAINWMQDMNVDFFGTRSEEVVVDFNGSVDGWAARYEPL